MPLYVFKCGSCGHEFEDLVAREKADDAKACPKCGKGSKRNEVTPFGISTKSDPGETLFSPKEIDKAVGADAEKRWGRVETDRKKRWAIKSPQPIEVPVEKDGTRRPMEVIGNKHSRKFRKEYTEALTVHRAEREKKGLGQFDGPGTIIE